MAYGKKYELKFKNRIQSDTYRVELWEKDFAGDVVQLKGSETPFVVEYAEQELLEPVQAVTFTISFLNDGLGIEDFYSDDDQRYRIDFYFETDGIWPEKLLNTGYLVQDGASEPVTDRQHVITLKATDNVALLRNVKWNETRADYIGQFTLGTYVKECLQETGLYSHDSTIDMSLPLRIFSNLFENSTDDRSDSITADPFEETVLDSNIFKDDDSTYKDCYEVLTTILSGMNAVLVQADGCWNVIRRGEYKLFDGVIPGTQYVWNGSGTTITPFTLLPALSIARGGTYYPVEEEQVKTIQRPLRLVKNTFNYDKPDFVNNSNLQLPEGATPYYTSTVGDVRTDRYDIPTYFEGWINRGGITSFLEVTTDVSVDPEKELDRYIVVPQVFATDGGIQFNPIPVTKGDVINFSLSIRSYANVVSDIDFYVRIDLIMDNNTFDLLYRDLGNIGWYGAFHANEWDTTQLVNTGSDPGFLFFEYKDRNSEWVTINLTDSLTGVQEGVNIVPEDGMLLIQVNATNLGSATRVDMCFKDINLTIKQYINDSTQIIGQVHTDTGTSTIKAIQEADVEIDDSPRNSIGGTLFTDAISVFEYTDINTAEHTNIGDIYFTKTRTWHRGTLSEALRLGNIITQEILEFKSTSRIMVEGSFRNLRDGEIFISIINLFTIGWITDKFFLFGGLTLDYMDCVFNGRLIEIYTPTDIIDLSVFLTGDKEEELAITNGNITFDTITYYGGADSYFTVSDSNSKFTYDNGFDTTVQLSVIFFVPISGSGTATFTILKNGGVIATQTVTAIEHFKRIDFDLTESVTDTDYFQATVDTGGASVDIQSGSINITVNDVAAIDTFPYSFNYLYEKEQ